MTRRVRPLTVPIAAAIAAHEITSDYQVAYFLLPDTTTDREMWDKHMKTLLRFASDIRRISRTKRR